MAKRKANTQGKASQKTKLIMKSKQSACQKTNLSVDFKPNRRHQLYKQFKGIALFPRFNNDKKYFTPSFVLRFLGHSQSDQELEKLHQKKLTQYTTQVSSDQIMFPKPRSKNMYCGVCRDNYEDYYTHVHDEQHRQHAITSRFTKYINQLCVKFNPHFEKQQNKMIQNKLHNLLFKLKKDDLNYLNTGNSYETSVNKSRKEGSINNKRQISLSYSNNNNRTTIIISSD